MKNLKERRTIRKYSKREIPDTLLHEMLTLSERTPTMGNLQLYSVVITRDSKMKEKLSPAHFNQPMVKAAPVILTFCADFNRTTRWANERKAQPGYNNFLSFMNAATDALLYCQTFCNIAEEKGLGTCFLGTTVYMPQMIIDTLQLPKLVFPVATITLGWPDEMPSLTDRLPLESIIHHEKYKDYSLEKINDYYAEKESLEENKNFVEINHKETLAQVYTDMRYTKKDNEAMSETIISTLKSQGFFP